MSNYLKGLWFGVRFDFFYYLLVVLAFVGVSKLVKLNYVIIVFILLFSSVLRNIIKKESVFEGFFKNAVFIAVIVALFWFGGRLLGAWFVWLVLLGFVGFRLWKGRFLFMDSTRFIESKLFGKSLDRGNWVDGECPSFKKKKESRNRGRES